jgi:hypothetical protein
MIINGPLKEIKKIKIRIFLILSFRGVKIRTTAPMKSFKHPDTQKNCEKEMERARNSEFARNVSDKPQLELDIFRPNQTESYRMEYKIQIA